MPKIYVVGGGAAYKEMFIERGWDIAGNMGEADMLQFTGGADVHPQYYGELVHPETYTNNARDIKEFQFFEKALAIGMPMAGICRGGQFLNVASGGKMYQHVDNHAIYGTHKAFLVSTGEEFQVSSTHHQMMRPSAAATTLVRAGLSHYKQYMMGTKVQNVKFGPRVELTDIESVYYAHTNCLCYQPHPEFDNVKECRDVYFDLINTYLMHGGLVEPHPNLDEDYI